MTDTTTPDIDPRIATAARVEIVPTASLRRWDRNPHTGDIETIRASLRRFGQVTPIVRAPDGWIIAGNHTLQAAIEEGFPSVAVVTLDADESEQVAYGLASNHIGTLGEDDDRLVLALLRELDVLEGTGFTVDDVSDLNALIQEMQTAERSAPVQQPQWTPDGPHSGGHGDAGVMTEPSIRDRLESYQGSQVRSLVLDYTLTQYAWVTDRAVRVRADIGVESNSALLMALLADHLGEVAPS